MNINGFVEDIAYGFYVFLYAQVLSNDFFLAI